MATNWSPSVARLLARAVEHAAERERGLLASTVAPLARRQLRERLLGVRAARASRVGAGAAQQHVGDRVGLGREGEQQVVGRDLGVAVDAGALGRGRDAPPGP